MVLLVVANVLLLGHGTVYTVLAVGQGLIYVLAVWGLVLERLMKRNVPRLPHLAYFFCLSCYGMVEGGLKGLRGRPMATWEQS